MSDVSASPDLLRRNDEHGRPLLVPCAEVTVYWRGSMFARAERLIGVYRRILGDLGPSFKFFETGTMAGAKPLRPDSLETVPFWLQSRPRRDIYMMRMESGQKKDDPSEIALLFQADEDDDEPLGALRVCLPPTVLTEHSGQFVDRVAYYLGDLDFESGHAGYGVNWDPRGDQALDAQAAMAALAARVHAVDFFDLDVTFVAMRNTKPAGIKRVSWISLLGQVLVDLLGGIESLRSHLPASCKLRALPAGVLIAAGPRPLLGNPNRGDDLSPYRAVGEMLADLRFRDHQSLFASQAPVAHDETELWLGRFDRP